MDILTINDTPGTYPKSWYAATTDALPPFPKAVGHIKADVCVVGGGYAGLSSALHLARRGYEVVLLEASRVGSGASGRNGGQVGVGQRVDQETLEGMVGDGPARVLWDLGLESVELVKSLIAEGGIDCHWTDGILYADHRARYEKDTRAHVEHMRSKYDYDGIRYLTPEETRAEVACGDFYAGTLYTDSGHLHPLRYAVGLARMATEAGVRIYEMSRVTEMELDAAKPVIKTDAAEIDAGHVVLAMNGYHNNLNRRVSSRVMPINNFVVATERLCDRMANSLIPSRYAVADSRFVVNYFRLSHDNRLLFGGGESYGYRFPSDIPAKVRKPMLEIFPQLEDVEIDYAWGGTLGITMSRMPDFARLGPNALSVAGFSGHGVAMATLAGKLSAEAIAGQAERFDVMAEAPTPRFPGGAALRLPLLVAAMTWYSLRDKL